MIPSATGLMQQGWNGCMRRQSATFMTWSRSYASSAPVPPEAESEPETLRTDGMCIRKSGGANRTPWQVTEPQV